MSSASPGLPYPKGETRLLAQPQGGHRVLHPNSPATQEMWDLAPESVVKNLPAKAGDPRDAGLLPMSVRSPGGGNGNSLQYPCLGKPMDRGGW